MDFKDLKFVNVFKQEIHINFLKIKRIVGQSNGTFRVYYMNHVVWSCHEITIPQIIRRDLCLRELSLF